MGDPANVNLVMRLKLKLDNGKVVVWSRFIITGIFDDQLDLAPEERTLRDDGQEVDLYKENINSLFLLLSGFAEWEDTRLHNPLRFPAFWCAHICNILQ